MKLKVKLAREHCIDDIGDQDATTTCMLCYLAGFEKAREMAANEARIDRLGYVPPQANCLELRIEYSGEGEET